MKFGSLADLFHGAGAKHLTEVEVNKLISNQHEFQGVGSFRSFLGTPADKKTFPATFLWLDDTEDTETPRIEAFCTWSDVRRDNPDRSAEYHLYYAAESEPIVHRARAGDLLVIAQKKDGSLLILLSPAGSTIGQQLLWLFGLDLMARPSDTKLLNAGTATSLSWAARYILDELGIEPEEQEPDAFARLVEAFGLKFPTTAIFSDFARASLPDCDPVGAPDDTLIAWMEHEEALFRRLEREIVAERLKTGFMSDGNADVDGFLSFSLSVQNRRKSRAGFAFAHHVEAILKAHKIRYTREATTEKRNAADFLFPGEAEYQKADFPSEQLHMLAVKTTLKDRWRQVLAEADRISPKHLLTLQPAISAAQTNEMRGQNLQLVLPTPLHGTFQASQQEWLLGVGDFLDLVKT
nr:type II restriction endonuclease [uncultured Hyphomonas sp.]